MNKLPKNLLNELKEILKEDYDLKLSDQDLVKFSTSLIGFFSLLAKIDSRHKFENSPDRAIDSKDRQRLNKKV